LQWQVLAFIEAIEQVRRLGFGPDESRSYRSGTNGLSPLEKGEVGGLDLIGKAERGLSAPERTIG
jgi:hypothetical protein